MKVAGCADFLRWYAMAWEPQKAAELKPKRLQHSCSNAKYWATIARRTIHDDDEPTTQTVIRHKQASEPAFADIVFQNTTTRSNQHVQSEAWCVLLLLLLLASGATEWPNVFTCWRLNPSKSTGGAVETSMCTKKALAKKNHHYPSKKNTRANVPQRRPINQDFRVSVC